MSAESFLAALQLADSALPIGRFGHSFGLEAYLAADRDAGADELAELVESMVAESVGPLDAVAAVWAHRLATAGDGDGLVALDAAVTSRKLAPAARLASTTCGRRLAALVPTLTSDLVASGFASRLAAGETDGNLAVVEGALAAAVGLTETETALLELRGTATAVLSAAVRLGRLSASRMQAVQHDLAPALAAAARVAIEASDLRSTLPELELLSLAHARADTRLFVS